MPSDESQFDDRPANGESRLEFEQRMAAPRQYGRWVQLRDRGAIADFQFIYRDREGDPNDKRLLEAISQATGVWLPAYDQSWLPREFAPDYPTATSAFQQSLRDVLARGGAVGGLGGGASALADVVIEDQTDGVSGSPSGTVVLHGGSSTSTIIELFPRLTGKPKPRLVHCPAARESCRPSRDRHGQALADWLESEFSVWRELVTAGHAGSLDFMTTSNPADANDPQFVQSLHRADGLWFCGGDQRPLADLLVDAEQSTLFQREVHDLVRRGGVVGGTIAGLAIMADVMIEGGDNDDGRPAQARLSRGLGVLQNVLCEQHFDARGGRIERLTNLLHDHQGLRRTSPHCSPEKMIGIAVDESTAAILQADRLRVVGTSLAHVFLQSARSQQITWHALHPGDAARMIMEQGEPRLVIDEWEITDP